MGRIPTLAQLLLDRASPSPLARALPAQWDPYVGSVSVFLAGRAQLTTRVARAPPPDIPPPPPNRRGVRNPHGRRAIKSGSQPGPLPVEQPEERWR
jgi:hypothetical protein